MNKIVLCVLVLLVAHCGENIALADDIVSPPNWPGDEVSVANTKIDPVSDFRMGGLVVTLENTRLEEIRQRIGFGQILHQGDAADSIDWLCYTVSKTQSAQRIWLTSSEMGGGTYINGVIGVTLPKPDVIPKSCPELPHKYLPIGFGNQIWLGTSATKIRVKMGAPKSVKNLWSYSYSGNQAEFDITESLLAKIENGVAVEIFVFKVTSN